ncbi:MAG: AAA family ATPase [Victivallales bacterium]
MRDNSYYHRILEEHILPDSAGEKCSKGGRKVVLVLGARQTGKSTLLNHCLVSKDKTFTINLQDRRLRRQYESDEGLLVRELEARTGIDSVLIDEIQKVPALLDDVQYLYDRNPSAYEFFITGSSARQLKRKSANLLPGRIHTHLLSPVIQAEHRDCEILPAHGMKGRKFPGRDLSDCLIFGNLPGLYHEERRSWSRTLASYTDLFIENEIRQENIVDDMGAFARFLRIAALESGNFVNFTKLASDIGVAVNTVRNFYQVLEDTYIGIRISPFERSRKRIVSAPRFLLFDLGVRHILAELPLNDTLLKLDPGHIFEQWILIELYYRCLYMGAGYRLSTWRTATGAEVDAVIETPDEVIPVEIKWTDHPLQRDARHLETFIELHGKFTHRAYLVCRCPNRQKLTENVTAIPWNEF